MFHRKLSFITEMIREEDEDEDEDEEGVEHLKVCSRVERNSSSLLEASANASAAHIHALQK
jgi:hypothetical protein